MVQDSGKRRIFDDIRDLTATREAGFAKILAGDARFFCLSVGNSGNRHDPSKRSSGKSKSSRRAKNINRKGNIYWVLQKFVVFNVFLGKKNGIRDSDGKSVGCGIVVKKKRECGIRTPFQTLISVSSNINDFVSWDTSIL